MVVRKLASQPSNLGYAPSLDGLRAIAVLLVMLTHANFQIGDNGVLGVDIFFALSGFLITTLLLEEYSIKNSISIVAFYTRRVFRLFPALYFTLTTIALYALIFANDVDQNKILWEIISSALYLNNVSWVWGWGNDGLLLGHTWSLAVEEQFYLIWPWIVILALRLNAVKGLLIGLLCFITLAWALKFSGNVSNLGHSIIHEAIFVGCLAAIFRWKWQFSFQLSNITISTLLVLVILLGVLPYPWYIKYYEHGSRVLLAIATCLIILGLVEQPKGLTGKVLTTPLFVGIGKISYALYLWHVPVFKWFKWHSTLHPWQSFVLKFAVTFLLAGFSWILIERRATRLGREISNRIMSRIKK